MSQSISLRSAFVLAHQGGWDELLWVAAPLAIVAGLLFLANRRANKLHTTETRAPDHKANNSERK